MPIHTANVRRLLAEFDFRSLFTEELGWDTVPRQPLLVSVGDEHFELRPAAEKRGMMVLLWEAPPRRVFPDRNKRLKIYREVSKLHFEHILIFADAAHTAQEWTWVRRETGRPLAPRVAHWRKGQSNDALIQKLDALAFGIEQEESLTLVDVARGAKKAFDVERVTKRFYDRFQKEHAAFLKFVQGIAGQGDREWYASVMLNRLMFVYFIQKKGFLDGDRDYLRRRLAWVREQYGSGKFHSFYRGFLLTLFHEGLGSSTHSPEVKRLLGRVPYLNGGLFDLHELEREHPDIQIADEAFEGVFAFFEEYEWHLDDRPLREGNEINPDVLGYIFEKYINQKQMGAYYTKEDITEYIGKNTLLPFLFDAAKRRCEVAFRPEGAIWGLLRENPDRYLYPAVRQGVVDAEGNVIPLPPEIEAGVDDVAKREGWNRPADPEYALPTETWREHVARRTRCLELRERLRRGEVHEINDLITYNLDIRQFAEDVIFNSEGPELLRAFWYALAGRVPLHSNEKPEHGVTVLDPTCGSGAFLFAALNVLQPLYDACLERMQVWVDELESAAQPAHPEKFRDFREILSRVNDRRHHPNRDYFVLKSIILNNLFGVDIMAEAVEICKLRLFLKLVAQVERVEDVEPLPDIDFNIRAGNTLVGFATLDEVRRAVEGEQQAELMLGDKRAVLQRIEEDAETVDRAYRVFQEMQMREGMDADAFHGTKDILRERLTNLEEELNRYLAREYGVDPDKLKEYEKWKESHQPFHWLVDFYGIMSRGGFDVIIGNPPWKEYSAVKKVYTVRGYRSESCGNLHGICTERALQLRNTVGALSFIVQLPLVSSSRMSTVREILKERSAVLHVIPFDDRPGKLFEGLQHCRSVIFLSFGGRAGDVGQLRTARYQRWHTEARPVLFDSIEYARVDEVPLFPGLFPKFASDLEDEVFQKIKRRGRKKVGAVRSRWTTRHFVFYQEATQYWTKVTVGLPYYAKNGVIGAPAHGRYLYFDSEDLARSVSAMANSSLFYSYFIAFGDCFHLSDTLVSEFPLAPDILSDRALVRLGEQLMANLKQHAEIKTINTSGGDRITYAEFYGAYSKPIIDEIDRVLAQHYGFTDDELDFIINYDIKYRMGQDADEAEDAA
jgi:hypothetical protein